MRIIRKIPPIRHLKIPYLFSKYKQFTMIPWREFKANLILCDKFRNIDGAVVECGVWRGGMSAAISELLGPKRKYFLFDSFEGLPPAKPIDGAGAFRYQANKNSKYYYDNCGADISYATSAMKKSRTPDFEIIKGWFSKTLKDYPSNIPIAILRVDGDWYDSTMDCFTNLYPLVKIGGIIILDDYRAWEGCSKAVHDYLSKNKLADRIDNTKEGLHYIIKRGA